jgi:hypothetical protein
VQPRKVPVAKRNGTLGLTVARRCAITSAKYTGHIADAAGTINRGFVVMHKSRLMLQLANLTARRQLLVYLATA